MVEKGKIPDVVLKPKINRQGSRSLYSRIHSCLDGITNRDKNGSKCVTHERTRNQTIESETVLTVQSVTKSTEQNSLSPVARRDRVN